MTLPYERRRAIEWAGELLREIRQESKEVERFGAPIPPKIRELAIGILRHYPEPWQIRDATRMDQTAVCDWISGEPFDKQPNLNAELHRRILSQDHIEPSTLRSALRALKSIQEVYTEDDEPVEPDDKHS